MLEGRGALWTARTCPRFAVAGTCSRWKAGRQPATADKSAPPQSSDKSEHSKACPVRARNYAPAMPEPWPHAPPHHFTPGGTYVVTAGTLGRKACFDTPARLDLVLGLLFENGEAAGVELEAWAILRNHYHLVANFAAARAGLTLSRWLAGFHAAIGRELNKLDDAAGRRVMHQHWDTELTFEKSWLARLHYVHHNPVHHRLVATAAEYPWCSARWFETNASAAFVKTVRSFKIDRVHVPDDF